VRMRALTCEALDHTTIASDFPEVVVAGYEGSLQEKKCEWSSSRCNAVTCGTIFHFPSFHCARNTTLWTIANYLKTGNLRR
jgi:hypothetical protein